MVILNLNIYIVEPLKQYYQTLSMLLCTNQLKKMYMLLLMVVLLRRRLMIQYHMILGKSFLKTLGVGRAIGRMIIREAGKVMYVSLD